MYQIPMCMLSKFCTVDIRSNLTTIPTAMDGEFNLLLKARIGFSFALIVPEIMEVTRNDLRHWRTNRKLGIFKMTIF